MWGIASFRLSPTAWISSWAAPPTCSCLRRAARRRLCRHADKRVVGLYFIAHWCPPCREFTPKLAETYTMIKGTGKSFEIVFVSSNRDETAFTSYHKEMPWLTLPFANGCQFPVRKHRSAAARAIQGGQDSFAHPSRPSDLPGALQGRPQRHNERPAGRRFSVGAQDA